MKELKVVLVIPTTEVNNKSVRYLHASLPVGDIVISVDLICIFRPLNRSIGSSINLKFDMYACEVRFCNTSLRPIFLKLTSE